MPASKATAPKRRTQIERRAQAEQKLLIAAREIVARKGWIGMRLNDVGDAAGYSRGLAAHHFGSKSGLLRALATHINANFMQDVQRAPPVQEGLPSLLQFIHTYFSRTDQTWTNTRALLLLMVEASTEDSDTGDILSAYNAEVLSYLERHIEAGKLAGNIRADVSASSYAALIMGSLRGVMLQKLLQHSNIDLHNVRDDLIDMVTRAMTP